MQSFSLLTKGSQGGNSAPQGTFGNTWIHFWLSELVRRCYWHLVEFRDAAKHPRCTGQPLSSTTKNDPASDTTVLSLRSPALEAKGAILIVLKSHPPVMFL